MKNTNELTIITAQDLSMVDQNSLNEKQLKFILNNTPAQYVKSRPAKGGGTWNYVSTSYIRKVLNLMFGWNWDFEILDEKEAHGEIIVKGRLTCRTPNGTIIKTQYGNKEIAFKRGTKDPLSIGNDYKSAASDALKKCAAEIGIAADVYSKDDFRAVNITTQSDVDVETLRELAETATHVTGTDLDWIKKVIDNREEINYLTAYKILNK